MEATKTLAPPASKKKSVAPRAHEWAMRLRELPREWKMMVEDFGLTPNTLSRYAEQAKRNDVKAIERLEPLKQFYFTLMGMTQHERVIRYEEGDRVTKPVTQVIDGQTVMMKETRSVFGMREGYDMATEGKGRRPRPGNIRDKVDEHFYDLVVLLEWLKKNPPKKLHGRAHPDPDAFKESHKAVAGAGSVESKAFTDKKALEAAMRKVIGDTEDPVRRDMLELLIPYLTADKKTEWNGLD